MTDRTEKLAEQTATQIGTANAVQFIKQALKTEVIDVRARHEKPDKPVPVPTWTITALTRHLNMPSRTKGTL
jgi:hypothetical protein